MRERSDSNGKRAALGALFFLSVLLILPSCGGGGGYSVSSTIPCLFSGLAQLIYPIPGATSVPDAPGQIVFATSQLFPSSFDVLVNNDPNPNNASHGTAAFFQRIQQSQVPSPSASLQISNPFYESAATSATFPHATYYVFLNDTLGGCVPVTAGSFTTQ